VDLKSVALVSMYEYKYCKKLSYIIVWVPKLSSKLMHLVSNLLSQECTKLDQFRVKKIVSEAANVHSLTR